MADGVDGEILAGPIGALDEVWEVGFITEKPGVEDGNTDVAAVVAVLPESAGGEGVEGGAGIGKVGGLLAGDWDGGAGAEMGGLGGDGADLWVGFEGG